jgi:hypothetical protein
VTAQLNQLRSDLEMAKATNPAEQSEIRAIADHMDGLLYREEMMWQYQVFSYEGKMASKEE